jgi:hopanoid-associated phosphorylase
MTVQPIIGALVGMRSEASLLPFDVRATCSGGMVERARVLAEQMLDDGAEALLSFGIAGGLVAGLAPGDLVVGTGVELGGAVLVADPTWCRRLSRLLPGSQTGLVAASAAVAGTPDAKRQLREATGALAVDLESASVAEACLARGRPFAVLRAIADPVHRRIPPAALVGLRPDGTVDANAVIAGLLQRPGDLLVLLTLALESRRALSALGAAVRQLGPALGFKAA